MDRRVDRRSVVVEWLGRGRAVVMTADGAFREAKLPARLARRGAEAVGHELPVRTPISSSVRLLGSVEGKRVGWAAMAAVCVGLALVRPVPGWLGPSGQMDNAAEEYRLRATIRESRSPSGGGAQPVGQATGGRAVADRAPEIGAVGSVRASAASDGFVLSRPWAQPAVFTPAPGEEDRHRRERARRPAGGGRTPTLHPAPVRVVGATGAGTTRGAPSAAPAAWTAGSEGWAARAGR